MLKGDGLMERLRRAWLVVVAFWALASVACAATLKGVVKSAATGEPVGGAEVFLVELNLSAAADDSGAFSFDGIPKGSYTLIVSATGFKVLTRRVELVQDVVTVELELEVSIEVELEEEVVVEKKVVLDTSPQVSVQTFDREEIQDQAGVFEDVLRALQVLPGVTAVGDFAADMYIRGGDRGENAIFIDRIYVMFPYHLAGGLSIINTELVREVRFYAGGFPAEYPMAVSGVTDVTYREGPADRLHGAVMVSLLSLSSWLGAPLSENIRALASFRRSYYDWLLSALAENDVVAPMFGEYMAKFTFDPTPVHKIRVLGLVAQDGLDTTFEDKQTLEERDVIYNNESYILGVDWRYIARRDLFLNTTLSYQLQRANAGISGTDPLDMDLSLNVWEFRQDAVYEYTAGSFQLGSFGAAMLVDAKTLFSLQDRLPGVDSGDRPESVQIDFSRDEPIYLAGFYAQNEADIIRDKLRANFGARADHYQLDAAGWDFSPRAALSYLPTDRLVLKLAWGIYYDPPLNIIATDDEFGNPDLLSERSTHYVAGAEYKLGEHSLLRVESYYKDMDRLIYYEIDWQTIEINGQTYTYADPTRDVHYLNSGRGRAYGFEVFLQKRKSGWLDGWLSYAYAVTQRNSGLSGDYATGWYYPTQDQRHTLHMVANFRLPRRWVIALDFRYHTGRPYTPVVEWTKTEEDGSIYWEPTYGGINSARYPDYHRLDVRVQKTWRFDVWALSAFAEIYNIYNQKNIYAYVYTSQETEEKPKREEVYGLPFLPFVGVRAAF